MKKHQLTITIITLLFFINGCTTDPQVTPTATIVNSVIFTNVDNESDTTYFMYDASARLIKTVKHYKDYLGAQALDVIAYEYKGSDSIIIYGDHISDSTRIEVYAVGMNGYISKRITTPTQQYSYNTSGHLVLTDQGTDGNISWIVNGDGNATRRILVPFYPGASDTTTYTFLTSTNFANNTATGQSFFGKSNTNLVNTESVSGLYFDPLFIGLASHSITFSYSYEFDSEGRVTKQTKTVTARNGSNLVNVSNGSKNYEIGDKEITRYIYN